MKKEIYKVFKQNDLIITIEANKKIVDFRVFNLDLRTGIYKPYRKPTAAATISYR